MVPCRLDCPSVCASRSTNPLSRAEVQDINRLATKKGRREVRRYAAEGVRLLEEAVRFNVRPRELLAAEALLGERGLELVKRFAAGGVTIRWLPSRQLEQLATTEQPQGVIGLFDISALESGQLSAASARRVLICDGIGDPGNLGTLMRSALAFGFRTLVACGATADQFAPKVIRASAGAWFGLTVVRMTTEQIAAMKQGTHMQLIAADTDGAVTLAALRSMIGMRPLAVMVGSEAEGLSYELSVLADWRVRIGHSQDVESLNAAVAGSIIMKELYDEP